LICRTPLADFYTTKVPKSSDVGKFMAINATVIRTGMVKMLDTQKLYTCQKCNRGFVVKYDIEQFNMIPKPQICLAATEETPCNSSKFKEAASNGTLRIKMDIHSIR
jgi:DNA replicative helicase MCM subunit Mcm2 (Cdc46/Mcm family)